MEIYPTPPRYAMQQDRDKTWSVMDTAIDETRKESRVIMGLSRKQVKVIIKALNKPSEGLNDDLGKDKLRAASFAGSWWASDASQNRNS